MNSFNQSLSGRCGCWDGPVLRPPYRWPALLAGCQPRVSWSMLVKRALIWVWQGNQQPNSTVKLNSTVEHRSASFMLRLQKGKVPQHQFVTESCGTELAFPTKHSGRERAREEGREGRECVRLYLCVAACLCVAKSPRCLLLHPHWLPTTAGKKEGFTSVVWVGWIREREERVENERGERGWVCYMVHESRRIVILKLPDDSLSFFSFYNCCISKHHKTN